jgi:DNA-binding transcriptional MerR regulator
VHREGWSAGELAAEAGVTVRTLHHYEHVGLLRPKRTAAGHRRYEQSDLDRVSAIVGLRTLGFGLDEIEACLADRLGLYLALRRRDEALDRELATARRRQASARRTLEALSTGADMNVDDWRTVMRGDGTNNEMRIRLATGSTSECDARDRVAAVLARWDISRYRYTDEMTMDDGGRTFSHPELTLRTADVPVEDASILALVLHELMYWAAQTVPGTTNAINEAHERYPEPPADPASDAASTWLHFPVCLLHRDALIDLLGEDTGRALFAELPYFRWIHQQLLSEWADEFRDRHQLILPAQPPLWDDPETTLAIPSGPTVRLLSGHPLEREVADKLIELHATYDLRPALFSRDVAISGTSRPTVTPVPTLGTRAAGDIDEVLAHYIELQHQWRAVTNRTAAPPELQPYVPTTERLPRELVEAIVVACAETLAMLSTLLGPARAARLTENHPLNGEIYRQLSAAPASS